MKKSILTLAVATLFASALLTSCSSPSEKVVQAQNNVDDANKNLDNANKEYLADIESYRKVAADKIAANEKSIVEFRTRKDIKKLEARIEYTKKLDELEKKNTDLKKSLDDYKADGKDKWDTFKAEFSKNMDGIGNAFKELTTNKSK